MLREMQRFVRSVLTAVKTHHCQENKGCAMQASSCLCSICPLLPEWYPHVVLSVIMCAYVCFPSISLQVHPRRAEAWAPLSKPSLWFLLIAQCYHSEAPFWTLQVNLWTVITVAIIGSSFINFSVVYKPFTLQLDFLFFLQSPLFILTANTIKSL